MVGANRFFHSDWLPGGANLLVLLLGLPEHIRLQQFGIGFGEDFAAFLAEELFAGVVCVNVMAELVFDPRGARRVFHEGLETCLAFAQVVDGPNARERARTMSGQDLQELQVGTRVGIDAIALNGDDAQRLASIEDGNEQERRGGAAGVTERAERGIEIVSLAKNALRTVLKNGANVRARSTTLESRRISFFCPSNSSIINTG